MEDKDLINKGIAELEKIGFCVAEDFLDGIVVRMPKTYPAYFGSYDQFDKIRSFTDSIDNLFLLILILNLLRSQYLPLLHRRSFSL